MRLIYGFLCLAAVAGCQTMCDKVSESSAVSNHVSVAIGKSGDPSDGNGIKGLDLLNFWDGILGRMKIC